MKKKKVNWWSLGSITLAASAVCLPSQATSLTGCDKTLQLTPDFKISYADYCTQNGNLNSLLQYYSAKCDEAEVKLSALRTRIAEGETGLERFLDGHRYASNYYCAMTPDSIRNSVMRQKTCQKAEVDEAACESAQAAPANVKLIQGTVKETTRQTMQSTDCVAYRDFRDEDLIKIEATNHCGAMKIIALCFVEHDSDRPTPYKMQKQGKLPANEVMNFTFKSQSYSPYSYSATACDVKSRDQCQVTCP